MSIEFKGQAVKLDLKNWSRGQHFEFFKGFSDPYFNTCINLNAKKIFCYAQQNNFSFSHAYLYLALKAVNHCRPMCLRIKNAEVWQFKQINSSVVQLCDDDTFRFSYIDYIRDFTAFDENAGLASRQAKSQALFSAAFAQNEGRLDTLYISVLPWLSFTSFKHATHLPNDSGIPKLVFGKYDEPSGKMPLSIEVHHALMDGVHLGQFVFVLQGYLDEPRLHL